MDKLLLSVFYFGFTTSANVKEYCQTEGFEATCPGSEVVLMTRAEYGRMATGRCVKQNYGYIGCSTSVLHIADSKCSGKNSCTIRIPDPQMDDTQPCPDDLKTYFLASFTCIPVAKASKELCRSSTYLKLVSDKGYLSSEVAVTTGCGSPSSPWILEAQPGRNINLTLLDFTRTTGIDYGASHTFGGCRELLIIKEAEAPELRITNCETMERERHLYTSKSNAIEIKLLSSHTEASQFLVQYTVTGCKDPESPKNSWLKRNGNSATVGCKGKKNLTWQLRCLDGVWFGTEGNCSSEYISDPDDSSNYGPLLLPNELSIAIILVIALILGIIILTIGLLYLRRKSQYADRSPRTKNVVYGPGPVLPPGAKYPMPPPPPSGRIARKYDENDYAMIWELQSSGNDSGKGMSVRSASITRPMQGVSTYTTYTEDMIPQTYQASGASSPKSIQDSCSSPKYFEVDPSRTSSVSGVNVGTIQGRYST